MLAEPAQSLTDLALGVVALVLAAQLRRLPAVHRHWRAASWWLGAAALAGAVYHGTGRAADAGGAGRLGGDQRRRVIAVSFVLSLSDLLNRTLNSI